MRVQDAMIPTLIGGVLLLVGYGIAWGNAAPLPVPPLQSGQVQVKAVIKHKALDNEKKEIAAKVVIPLELVLAELRRLDLNKKTGSNFPAQQGNIGSLRTILAGIAMSLAAVSMVFVARRSKSASRQTVMLVAGLVIAGSSAVACADLIFPGSKPGPRPGPPNVPAKDEIQELVIIEFETGGKPIDKTVKILLRD